MEFLRSFLRRHLAGKPVVTPSNVGYFLRLQTFHNVIQSDTLRKPVMWNGKGKVKDVYFLRQEHR